MGWQLVQLYESVGVRDLVEIVILAVAIYALLRLLGRTRGSGLVRGLGLVVVVAFLAAQVIIAAFDLMELGRLSIDQWLPKIDLDELGLDFIAVSIPRRGRHGPLRRVRASLIYENTRITAQQLSELFDL